MANEAGGESASGQAGAQKKRQVLLFVNKKKQKNFVNFGFGPFQHLSAAD
jgi:lipid-binding SYLF domain-containing protein